MRLTREMCMPFPAEFEFMKTKRRKLHLHGLAEIGLVWNLASLKSSNLVKPDFFMREETNHFLIFNGKDCNAKDDHCTT